MAAGKNAAEGGPEEALAPDREPGGTPLAQASLRRSVAGEAGEALRETARELLAVRLGLTDDRAQMSEASDTLPGRTG